VPVGHHYLVLYSDLQKMREMYSTYVKLQLENHPNSVIVIMPYYETTDKVREVLESKGLDVRKLETEGLLVIVDIEKVITSPFLKGADAEKLRKFTREIENRTQGKTIFVIAGMSVFNHLKKGRELLDYERVLHKDLQGEKWKEICQYNQRDFHMMFTREQSEELLRYHNDRTITI